MHHSLKKGVALLSVAAAGISVAVGAGAASAAKSASICPGGKVRFGVEPYDSGPKFVGAYKALATALSQKLGCPVQLFITQNYTAEVEAMRAKKLDLGEFGPLGYIFANRLANAQPVAVFGTADGKPDTYTAALWVPTSSPIKTVADLKGHTIAFSDPGSTSGNLLPRAALKAAGINPDKDVTIQYAGSHTASLLALTNGKVDAGEVNSQQQATASTAGQFDATKFRTVWRSAPIPNDPITVRGDLSPAFKAAVKSALLGLTPAQLNAVNVELGVNNAGKMLPGTDALYKPVRAVVDTLGLDIKAIG